jgi:CHAT domain-containing protein
VVIDTRPAREAIAEQRKLQQLLMASRSGGDEFAPLPGTRYEVESLAQLFKSDDRQRLTLLRDDARESALDGLATSGELGRIGFMDLTTALLMQRFYANILGRRAGRVRPLLNAEALAEAKSWLRGLRRDDMATLAANLSGVNRAPRAPRNVRRRRQNRV